MLVDFPFPVFLMPACGRNKITPRRHQDTWQNILVFFES